MSQSTKAEPPSVLSVQVQAAIDSYQNLPIGPSLASHIADELLAWLGSYPSYARGGGDGGLPLRRQEREPASISYGAEGPSPWSHDGGDGPTPLGCMRAQQLTFSPLTSQALVAVGMQAESASPFGNTESHTSTASQVFEWNDVLNVVEGGGHVYAQFIAMKLTIWDTGDWQLFIGFRTFARVRIKVNISLTDGGVRGLCTVTSGWKTFESTSGHIDCIVFGRNSPCVGEFFSVIKNAWRSTDGFGPLR